MKKTKKNLNPKPLVSINLRGPEGNVFNVVGKVVAEIILFGQWEKAEELRTKALEMMNNEETTYQDMLKKISEYVDLHIED